MTPISQAVTVAVSAFAACGVEAVEAFTIVLAVSVVRGPRPALAGSAAALVLLTAAMALGAPLIARIPPHVMQLSLGVLVLVFGLGWLRKAVLWAGGALPLHDEAAAFAAEKIALAAAPGSSGRADRAADWLAGLTAFQAVLLEGLEVVFIVLATGARPGLLGPAAAGAGAACILVVAAGLALRAPLARVPENSLKFLVGGLLTGFGVFWCCEGLGVPWPGGDFALPALAAFYLAAGAILAALVRRRRSVDVEAGAR